MKVGLRGAPLLAAGVGRVEAGVEALLARRLAPGDPPETRGDLSGELPIKGVESRVIRPYMVIMGPPESRLVQSALARIK